MKKQHEKGTCNVLGRSVVFSAYYAIFFPSHNSLIITTLIYTFIKTFMLTIRILAYPVLLIFVDKLVSIQKAYVRTKGE